MENILEKSFPVAASQCDHAGKLGIRAIFDIFMDIAAEHAQQLGVGYYDLLARHCFWVAARTKVCFYERPAMFENITVRTWPAKPSAVKCDRYYRITCGTQVTAEGKTEWAVQSSETGRVCRTDSIGYPETAHCEDVVCEGKFARFPKLSEESAHMFGTHIVTASDIDTGAHMNNVAYIRMLLGMIPTAEQDEKPVRELEIAFRQGCYEGEMLRVLRADEDNIIRLQVNKDDGTAAANAVIAR